MSIADLTCRTPTSRTEAFCMTIASFSATKIWREFHGLPAIRAIPQFLFLVCCSASWHAHADSHDYSPIARLLKSAELALNEARPDPTRIEASSSRSRQMPIYKAVMAQPLQAPYRVGMVAEGYRQSVVSPYAALAMTGSIAGLSVYPPKEDILAEQEKELRASADPLSASLAWMRPKETTGHSKKMELPNLTQMPEPLRFEVAMVLATIGRSNRSLQRAFLAMPAGVTSSLLRRQALDDEFLPFEELDYRKLLPLVEREALHAGMLGLTASVERLKHFVTSTLQLPLVEWSMETPFGQIVVDTTGRNNTYRLKDPLLVLDVGGDDVYEFLPRSDTHRIVVLLDHQGNDRYIANAPGSDPSAATLGYGILWDTEGDDQYQGTKHAQASALFGEALLVDAGGTNAFIASSHTQAHAIAGIALLLGSSGSDLYSAQAYAQGSAGPEGVATLIEPAGNDQYTLNNSPLIKPSAQLPASNSSMGQGAAWGIRGDFIDGRSTTGGVGILMDMGGNDHYVAQVFAQGAGYQEGLGILVDDGGNNTFDAAWYAMGSAAHRGAGILVKRGIGNDHYRASHSTSIGAAHDFSVGIFLDEGGDEIYELGDLGLGAANDNSFALFVDAKGNDKYQVVETSCRAFGAAKLSQWGNLREDVANLGLFMDLGGTDSYAGHCNEPGNNTQWETKRVWPQLNLRSEVGLGIDGEFALPFYIRPRTSPLSN